MPKSRNNRKNKNTHKKRLNAYKERVKQKQNQLRKSYMDMMKQKQQDELQEEIDKGQVENVVDASEVDIGEITDVDVSQSAFGLEDPDLDLGDMKIEE